MVTVAFAALRTFPSRGKVLIQRAFQHSDLCEGRVRCLIDLALQEVVDVGSQRVSFELVAELCFKHGDDFLLACLARRKVVPP